MASYFVIDRPGRQITFTLVGRKARDFFRRRGVTIQGEHVGIFSHLSGKDARAVTAPAMPPMFRSSVKRSGARSKAAGLRPSRPSAASAKSSVRRTIG